MTRQKLLGAVCNEFLIPASWADMTGQNIYTILYIHNKIELEPDMLEYSTRFIHLTC